MLQVNSVFKETNYLLTYYNDRITTVFKIGKEF